MWDVEETEESKWLQGLGLSNWKGGAATNWDQAGTFWEERASAPMGGKCPRWPRVDAGKAKACIRDLVWREKFSVISISKILKTAELIEIPKRMNKTEIYSKIQEMRRKQSRGPRKKGQWGKRKEEMWSPRNQVAIRVPQRREGVNPAAKSLKLKLGTEHGFNNRLDG